MAKTFTALAAVAAIAAATMALPTTADARNGGAIAAGVIGGLAAGALIGSAAANNGYYGYGPGYNAAGPAYYGRCYIQRQRVWDGYGWRIQRVRVCD
jgi:hypothetical protein